MKINTRILTHKIVMTINHICLIISRRPLLMIINTRIREAINILANLVLTIMNITTLLNNKIFSSLVSR